MRREVYVAALVIGTIVVGGLGAAYYHRSLQARPAVADALDRCKADMRTALIEYSEAAGEKVGGMLVMLSPALEAGLAKMQGAEGLAECQAKLAKNRKAIADLRAKAGG